jgi:hypothetical protein
MGVRLGTLGVGRLVISGNTKSGERRAAHFNKELCRRGRRNRCTTFARSKFRHATHGQTMHLTPRPVDQFCGPLVSKIGHSSHRRSWPTRLASSAEETTVDPAASQGLYGRSSKVANDTMDGPARNGSIKGRYRRRARARWTGGAPNHCSGTFRGDGGSGRGSRVHGKCVNDFVATRGLNVPAMPVVAAQVRAAASD